MNLYRYLSLKPSSVRSRFAKRFLGALAKINKKPSPASSSSSSSRCLRVKAAADWSLARAVGPRRAWSRALLRRIRSQATRRRSRRRISLHQAIARRRNSSNCGLKLESKAIGGRSADVLGHADELRRLLPGGEGMDTCRLLGEMVHYMQCLKTQVQVMRSIADYYSSSSSSN